MPNSSQEIRRLKQQISNIERSISRANRLLEIATGRLDHIENKHKQKGNKGARPVKVGTRSSQQQSSTGTGLEPSPPSSHVKVN